MIYGQTHEHTPSDAEAHCSDHLVQFYTDDRSLVQAVGDFIGAGLGSGQGGIVIATPPHQDALDAYLDNRGLNIGRLKARGRYTCLDAAGMLAQCTKAGAPDAELFHRAVDDVLARNISGPAGPRLFGEMAALLWAKGDGAGAMNLERLWCQLGENHLFSLFCAYPAKGFFQPENSRTYKQICQAHTQVIVPEDLAQCGWDQPPLEKDGALSKSAAAQLAPQFFIGSDGAERQRAEQLLDAQKETLEKLVRGAPLSEVLASLARTVEQHCNGRAVASILLLDEEGRLHNGASPSLPEDYLRAIDGIQIHADLGTCASAAATRRCVFTPDIDADPKWQTIKHLPLGLGFRAAWSMPILAKDGRVLGTFGTYFRECRTPSSFERRIVEILSRTAALAIERKSADEALRRSEAQFRLLTEALPQIVWTAQANGYVDYFNTRWYEFTGFSEVYGDENWRRILHAEDLPRCLDSWYTSVGSGQPFESEFRFHDRETGGYRWFLGRALPIRDDTGKIVRWLGTFTDIDDQKRASEKLERAVGERTASLREAIAQLEEFSYTVSHDLRAPLRGMHAYTQALLEDFATDLPTQAEEYLKRIAVNATRLDKMILDVLTFSRVARTDLHLERICLEKLVHQLVEQYPSMQVPHAQVRIDPLPDVLGHEPSLTQALSNLLNNAVKFVPPGVTPRVKVWAERRNGLVRIWVADNGIGINPRHQHRLFNMFERIHPELKHEGTGVGLAIVRKAVERMGGRVGVESDGTDGSRFWIEVRAVDEDLPCHPYADNQTTDACVAPGARSSIAST